MSTPRFYFYIDGSWVEAVDGDGGVRTRSGVSLGRGYANENSRLKPGMCSFSLDNRDLRYSDYNPMSPYFGNFGQNTAFKLIDENTDGMFVWGTGKASTPDAAGISITGDIDIRVELELNSFSPYVGLMSKGLAWFFEVRSTGIPRLTWSPTGLGTGAIIANATAAVSSGLQALRVTLDVNNGAGGNTATFYTASTISGPWTQLGSPVVTAGTTSIGDDVGPLQVGVTHGFGGGSSTQADALYYKAELRNGINGSIVANPDFSIQSNSDTSFVDAQGLTWTLTPDPVDATSGAQIGYSDTRFYGEIGSLKQKRNLSETDHWTEVETYGVTQRLSQGGGARIGTALESWVPVQTASTFSAQGYWPLNERAGSGVGFPLVSDTPMVFTKSDSPTSRFGRGDMKLPWLEDGVQLYSGDVLHGSLGMDQTHNAWEFDFIYACQDDADVTLTIRTLGQNNIKWNWQVIIKPSTGQAGMIDPLGTSQLSSNWDFDLFDGVGKLVQIRATTSGSNTHINFVISTNYEGVGAFGTNDILDDGFSFDFSDPIGVAAPGWVTEFDFVHVGLANKPFNLSHVAIFACTGSASLYAIEVAAAGQINEQADTRLDRLCEEKGLAFQSDTSYTTALMGSQKPGDFVEAIEDCALADMGLLFEIKDGLGYEYISAKELYDTDATAFLTLDYSAQQITSPFDPVRDDKDIKNDVTVKREDGGEGRYEQNDGRYKVADPASGGVGRYESKPTLNLAKDSQTTDAAGWLVHIGTWDEPRFPTVTVNLKSVSALIARRVVAANIGDRITITNAQSLGFYDDIQLIVVGYNEHWDDTVHQITFNCVPARPYQVLTLNTTGHKLNSHGSTVNASFNAGADTSLSVAVSDGALWTTSAAQMPFHIKVAGVVLNVTNVTGASSPQTFTVDATPVNGVTKTIDAGESVRLERPATIAYT